MAPIRVKILLPVVTMFLGYGFLMELMWHQLTIITHAEDAANYQFFPPQISRAWQASFAKAKISTTEAEAEAEAEAKTKGEVTSDTTDTATTKDATTPRRLEAMFIPSFTKLSKELEAAAAENGIPWGICHYLKPHMAFNQTDGKVSCPPDSKKYNVQRKIPVGFIWQWPISYFYRGRRARFDHPFHREHADTFIVVNNPYDRMILYYTNVRRNMLRTQPVQYDDFSDIDTSDVNAYSKEHFNNWLQVTLNNRLLLGKDMPQYWTFDGCLVPQVDFVMDAKGRQLVTHVLQVETLNTSFPILMKEYGLSRIQLPNHLVFDNTPRGITVDDLDLQTLLLIEQYYAQDFKAFHYPTLSHTRNETPPKDTHPPRLEFVHIPKTGGTVIESVAAKAGIRWSICHMAPPAVVAEISENNTFCPGLAPWARLYGLPIHSCPHWHLPPQYFDLPRFPNNPYKNATLFCVVRNPYERVVSEFFYARQYASDRYKNETATVNVLNVWIRQAVGNALKATKGDIANNLTGSKGYFFSAGHYIPQYDYVYEKNQKVIHHVLKFENLHDDFHKLMTMYNMSLILPPKHENHVRKAKKHLGVDDLYPDVIHLINRVYANDFREFGYEMRHVRNH